MDDNSREWVECKGVASGCGEQEVGVASGSGWNLWVWLLGVVVRRYIDFLTLQSLLLLYLFFLQQLFSFKIFFSFMFQYFFVITFYVLNNFFTQYKHTYGQIRASHGSHMNTVLYMKKHIQTYTSYPAMYINCMNVV